MAQVDFSNAHIEPVNNPVSNGVRNVALNSVITDSNGNQITTSSSQTLLKKEPKQLVYRYTGTFTASGTALYLYANYAWWRIYNITFNTNDTYDFKIKANIVL